MCARAVSNLSTKTGRALQFSVCLACACFDLAASFCPVTAAWCNGCPTVEKSKFRYSSTIPVASESSTTRLSVTLCLGENGSVLILPQFFNALRLFLVENTMCENAVWFALGRNVVCSNLVDVSFVQAVR